MLDGRAADTAVGVINQEVNWVVQNFTFGLAPELDLGPLYGHYDSYESGKPVGDATTWAMEKAGAAATLRKQVKKLFTKKLGSKFGDDAAEEASKKASVAPKGTIWDAPQKYRGLSNNELNKTIGGPQVDLLRKLLKGEGAGGLTRNSLEAAAELSRRAILHTVTTAEQVAVRRERLRLLLEALGNLP